MEKIYTLIAALLIYIVICMPIRHYTKTKKWYVSGLIIIGLAAIIYLYAWLFAMDIGCHVLNDTHDKCGLNHAFNSFLISIYFAAIGLLWLVSDKFFPKK